ALDAGSHVPIRTEHNVLNLFLKNRRLVTISLSDDYVLVERNRAVGVHRACAILGKVYHDGRLREGMRNPAPSLECQLDLSNSRCWRRVKFVDRARVEVAGGSFAMPVLVMLYAVDDRTFIDRGVGIQLYTMWNVADDLQKPAQAHHTRVGLAGPHGFCD